VPDNKRAYDVHGDETTSFVIENFTDNRGLYPQLEHFIFRSKKMEESENELDIDAAVCEEGAEKCQKARQN
jgi:hypothetical protein